jgi:hypothetical protein
MVEDHHGGCKNKDDRQGNSSAQSNLRSR